MKHKNQIREKIKTIEDLSLNAWPSHQIQYYDGWLLRFSYFYTHRTNSVEQVGESTIPVAEKILYCEEEYRKWGTPAIFKITPLLDPEFDGLLEARGYLIQHRTIVMVKDLSALSSASDDTRDTGKKASGLPDRSARILYNDRSLHETYGSLKITCTPFIPNAWIQSLFHLKQTTNVMHRMVVPSMYRAIPKETLCVQVLDGDRYIGTGLGILDRNFVGVYAIHVHPDYRRRGIARRIVEIILEQAASKNVTGAYLQVVRENNPARNLYRSLGFRDFYEYWFRVR